MGPDRNFTKFEVAVGVLLVVAFGVLVARVGTGFPGAASLQPNGQLTDATRDWLSSRAAVDGVPYAPLDVLAADYLGVATDDGFVHPRSPGALLLQLPLVGVPVGWAWPIMVWTVLLSAGVVAWAATRITGGRWWVVPLVGFGLLLSPAGLGSILVGSQGPLVAALVGLAWVRPGRWSGVGLGVAATLKMFPLLLIPMLWANGRRRMAAVASTVFVGSNAVGLLLPGVTVGGSVKVMLDQPNTGVPWNLSPELPTVAVVAVGAGLVWLSRRMSFSAVMSVGCVGMLVLSPVVWGHYLFVLVLPVAWAVKGLVVQSSLEPSPPTGPTQSLKRTDQRP